MPLPVVAAPGPVPSLSPRRIRGLTTGAVCSGCPDPSDSLPPSRRSIQSDPSSLRVHRGAPHRGSWPADFTALAWGSMEGQLPASQSARRTHPCPSWEQGSVEAWPSAPLWGGQREREGQAVRPRALQPEEPEASPKGRAGSASQQAGGGTFSSPPDLHLPSCRTLCAP